MSRSMVNIYCNQTVILKRGVAPDQYGEPNTPVQESLKARVDWENKLVRDHHGQEVMSVAKMILVYDGTIQFDDMFTISGRDHPIVQINRVQDFSSNHLEIRIA